MSQTLYLTEQLLAVDMRFSLNLPWRISVFTENGATKIGVLSPLLLLAQLSTHPMVERVARELEEKLIQIVDEAR
jgi:serine/threonine protein kinase HipA of HipAB toxin-antitoxin module